MMYGGFMGWGGLMMAAVGLLWLLLVIGAVAATVILLDGARRQH